jgi:hypothetical protein
MTITFKTPKEADVAMMKEFANIIDQALTCLGKPSLGNVAQVCASKLQEALMWFSHGVMNAPAAINTAVDVIDVAAAVTGNPALNAAKTIVNDIKADAAAIESSQANATTPVTPAASS